jgi:membrane-associated PAP2 superfamily phosphatase
VLLICTAVLFQVSDLDLRIQRGFFDAVQQQWLWDRQEPISKLILYDGIKILLAVYALGLMLALLASRWRASLRPYRKPIWVALLAIILIPALVNGLKAVSNVPCPRSIVEFGGLLPHVGPFDTWPPGTRPERLQRCFPAGHASGGFALLALALFARSKRQRVLALGFALTLGGLMGAYKMLIGDHFLSHTLITLLLSWQVIAGLSFISPDRYGKLDRSIK